MSKNLVQNHFYTRFFSPKFEKNRLDVIGVIIYYE
jgi:hypothetical protein